MDTENKPAEDVPNTEIGKDKALWRLILLGLCAVGVGIVIGIVTLQIIEYRFYKASPCVWPQSGAGGMVSAPAPVNVPPAPATTATSSAAQMVSTEPTSAPVPTNAPAAAQP